MSKYSTLLNNIADIFTTQLDEYFIRKPLTQEWPWENILWSGDKIQWAHLEKYYHPKASILHLVIMPQTNSPAPIYGFDLIELNGTLTGLFLDFTPTVSESSPFTEYEFVSPRPVPEWGNFFSSHFVCCKPQLDELPHATNTLSRYLIELSATELDDSICEAVVKAQCAYIDGQRKNPQTRRMLTAHCGEHLANRFIDEVLFPQIDK